MNWTHGIVQELIIPKTVRKLKVKWATECLDDFNKEVTAENITEKKVESRSGDD